MILKIKLTFLFFYISFCLIISCSSSCLNENNNSNNNNIVNHNNNSNKNVVTNNIENQNNNLNNNIFNPENNDSNQNNISPQDKCLSSDDYKESDYTWLRKSGYLSRPFCRTNHVTGIYHPGSLLEYDNYECTQNTECEMPEIESSSENGLDTKSITSFAGNVSITNYDGKFSISIEIMDKNNVTKIGMFYFGGSDNTLNTHIPSQEVIKGKKLTFIDRHVYKTFNGIIQFSAAFIKNPETDKVIFGSVAKDNDRNLGDFYDDLLPFAYTSIFKDRETTDICADFENEVEEYYKYIREIDDCNNVEYGDLVIQIDSVNYVIPAQSEGDIIIGNDEYGVVTANMVKYNFNHCLPDEKSSYIISNFYFFDRDFFVANPEYVPVYAECSE